MCDALAQPPDLAQLARCIGDADAPAMIGLTGHSPWLEELASVLLAGSASAVSIDFPKSAAMAIRTDSVAPSGGELVAFLTPDR